MKQLLAFFLLACCVQWGISQNQYVLSTKNGNVLLDLHVPSLPQNLQPG
jgi:hypothetical protein